MVISLVTGASSGLGRDISKLLCEEGHQVYVVARRRDKLLELKKECENGKGKIIPIVGDLTDKKFRIRLIKKIKKLDYFINNAGYGTAIEFEKQPIEDIEQMFNLNTITAEHLISLLLPKFRKQKKGRIICISSVVTFTPLPYFATYNATKAALSNFVRSLNYELKGVDISLSLVFPARMKTGFGHVAFKCYSKDKKVYERCMKNWNKIAGSSEKVAQAIVNNLDTKRLMIFPTKRAEFLYYLSRVPFMSNVIDFIMKNISGPKVKRDIQSHKMDKKYYKKK